MEESKKSYGLVVKKAQTKHVLVSSIDGVFNCDEDAEPSNTKAFDPRKIETGCGSSVSNRLSKAELDKALFEDPSVCQYDELFDEMEERRSQFGPRRGDATKEPKYVEGLIKSAAFRKRERARRMDRKIQKERHEEGDDFDDSECFVTENYRRKLEEREEEEKILNDNDRIDDINSVTKQRDLTQFYRQYLLKQREARGTDIDSSLSIDNSDKQLFDTILSGAPPSCSRDKGPDRKNALKEKTVEDAEHVSDDVPILLKENPLFMSYRKVPNIVLPIKPFSSHSESDRIPASSLSGIHDDFNLDKHADGDKWKIYNRRNDKDKIQEAKK